MIGAAATAHVHADDVTAGGERAGCVADDVLRTRGALKAVNEDDSEAATADFHRLPVAVAEDLRGAVLVDGAFDFDEERFGFREGKVAREEVAGEGLQVTVAQIAPRNEGRHERGNGVDGQLDGFRLGEE